MEKDHFKQIYASAGDKYHQMISVEDVDQNLKPALRSITTFKNKSKLDLGTGTGRIPLLFPTQNFTTLDLNTSMLQENQKQRDLVDGKWSITQGDMRFLPFLANRFDIITTGWALGHFLGWYQNQWQYQIQRVFTQVDRVLKNNGCFIIIETLTTGSLVPAPPTPGLANYYRWLEEKHQFQRLQIQTDFMFHSLDDAVHYSRFFFGEDLAEKVRLNQWTRLPEYTGIWYKFKHGEKFL
jgi:ubiquinone/menaquinone biosynthesis C-methylase UbiE